MSNAVNLGAIALADVPDVSDTTEDRAEAREVKNDSPDISCTVCGKDIAYMYAGRGRKPTKCEEHKKNNASRIGGSSRAAGSVAQAVQTLEMGYSALSMVLLMAGAHGAMASLNESLPGLREKNTQFLSQDPELVKKINAIGKTGGRFAFFSAQAMVLGPVAVIAAQELREKWGSSGEAVPGDSEQDVPATMGGFPVE